MALEGSRRKCDASTLVMLFFLLSSRKKILNTYVGTKSQHKDRVSPRFEISLESNESSGHFSNFP